MALRRTASGRGVPPQLPMAHGCSLLPRPAPPRSLVGEGAAGEWAARQEERLQARLQQTRRNLQSIETALGEP